MRVAIALLIAFLGGVWIGWQVAYFKFAQYKIQVEALTIAARRYLPKAKEHGQSLFEYVVNQLILVTKIGNKYE